jgi:DNA polymerase-3 subunit delta
LKLKANEVARALSAPDAAIQVFLIYGEDTGLVRERAESVSAKLVPDLEDPFAVTRLTEDDIKADPATLADSLAALSLTGGDRLVRLRLSGDNAAAAEVVTSIDTGTLTAEARLVIETGALRPTSKLRKAAEAGKRALAAPCYADGARDALALAEAAFDEEGLSLSPDARAMLAPYLEGDRALARSEIEKLILYKGLAEQRGGEPAVIDASDIAAVSAVGSEAALDAVLEPALGGDPVKTDLSYARALAAGANPVGVLRMLQRRIDQLDVFHSAGGDAGALARTGAPRFGPAADAFRKSARLWTGRRLIQARRLAFDAERSVKRSGAPAEAIVGHLLQRLSRVGASKR